MTMKKKILTTLSVVLVLGMAALGILAYLTSVDSDVNVMTLGNVSIKQIEQQKAEDGSLETFKQGKGLYPGCEISKIVTVENTGKSDCYFRTLIAFEDIDSNTFGINFPISEDGYKWSWGSPETTIEIKGVTYQVYEAIYTKPLAAGSKSPASLTKVVMSADATNEDMDALGGTYDILVLSQAVQVEGFADAQIALDTAFGDVTKDNATEWFASMIPATLVSDADGFEKALEEGGTVVLKDDITLDSAIEIVNPVTINLNGNTLKTVGLNFKNGGKVENGTVASNGNTNMVPHLKISGGTVEMDDVKVEIDDYLNYQANGNRSYGEYTGVEVANANAVMNDCVIVVKNETYRTWNYTYGITITDGVLTINNGSITVESAGASSTDLETAISCIGTSTVTLNDVVVNAETYGTTMGHLIVNTTDNTVTDADFVSYGGTYELNIIK